MKRITFFQHYGCIRSSMTQFLYVTNSKIFTTFTGLFIYFGARYIFSCEKFPFFQDTTSEKAFSHLVYMIYDQKVSRLSL